MFNLSSNAIKVGGVAHSLAWLTRLSSRLIIYRNICLSAGKSRLQLMSVLTLVSKTSSSLCRPSRNKMPSKQVIETIRMIQSLAKLASPRAQPQRNSTPLVSEGLSNLPYAFS
jgi:hypothetical protein